MYFSMYFKYESEFLDDISGFVPHPPPRQILHKLLFSNALELEWTAYSKSISAIIVGPPWPAPRANILLDSATNQGRSKGGSWGARDPPLCKPFLSKQPTILRGENAMTILFDPVRPPQPLRKILATPLRMEAGSGPNRFL